MVVASLVCKPKMLLLFHFVFSGDYAFTRSPLVSNRTTTAAVGLRELSARREECGNFQSHWCAQADCRARIVPLLQLYRSSTPYAVQVHQRDWGSEQFSSIPFESTR